jgi:hypothetical protein
MTLSDNSNDLCGPQWFKRPCQLLFESYNKTPLPWTFSRRLRAHIREGHVPGGTVALCTAITPPVRRGSCGTLPELQYRDTGRKLGGVSWDGEKPRDIACGCGDKVPNGHGRTEDGCPTGVTIAVRDDVPRLNKRFAFAIVRDIAGRTRIEFAATQTLVCKLRRLAWQAATLMHSDCDVTYRQDN